MVSLPLSPRGDAKNYPHGIHSLIRLVLRVFQFIFAITVVGLYGTDLHAASRASVAADSKWVFAVVVAVLSIVAVFAYFIHWRWLVVVDGVLFVLWTAVFGVFGNIYIGTHPTPRQSGQRRMKNAVWIDLINMLLWFLTLLSGLVIWWRTRGARTLHTGRADA